MNSIKAILGGRCMDTGERLGPPLSALIDTFVSVAGNDTKAYTSSQSTLLKMTRLDIKMHAAK
ncbi:hypothetical protein TELCIR_07009 [Teladorsagia circumcincta]|uniref:Uncharacterized protein n=1 Tax=Teladorsagia circumcincta TaxID=45464 RepID=A0A2G9ULJ1_TELCI|nr:hypothetical protein TELCIR_07009 [Teladorsagia circumcincta]